MQVGVHLPQVDLDGSGLSAGRLTSLVTAARNLGYAALSANDHFDIGDEEAQLARLAEEVQPKITLIGVRPALP